MITQIDREAARWLIELDTSPNDETIQRAFAAWIQQSPDHRTAFKSMESTWEAVDHLRLFYMRGRLPPANSSSTLRLGRLLNSCRPGTLIWIGVLALITIATGVWRVWR